MIFADVVNQKRSSLVVQMDPPKGTELTPILDAALAIRGRVDAFYFPENPMGVMRMHPIAPCQVLEQKKLATILNINARERNRLAIQSEMLAAWALGIRSIVLSEGRDPTYGDHPLAKSCKDLGVEGMLEANNAFKAGKDMAGQPITAAPDFHVGISIKLSDNSEENNEKARELNRLAGLGVQFVLLSATYDADTVKMFSAAAAGAGIKLFSSVLILKSVGMAKYLNTIPGSPNIPAETIQRILKAPIKQKAGLEIAADFMREIKDLCAGMVIVPLGWETKVPELLDIYEA